jgi:hypothetical protein
MRRETGHDGLAQLTQVVGQIGEVFLGDAGVDQQHTVRTLHDRGLALDELTLMHEDTLDDALQHGSPSSSSSNLPATLPTECSQCLQ